MRQNLRDEINLNILASLPAAARRIFILLVTSNNLFKIAIKLLGFLRQRNVETL